MGLLPHLGIQPSIIVIGDLVIHYSLSRILIHHWVQVGLFDELCNKEALSVHSEGDMNEVGDVSWTKENGGEAEECRFILNSLICLQLWKRLDIVLIPGVMALVKIILTAGEEIEVEEKEEREDSCHYDWNDFNLNLSTDRMEAYIDKAILFVLK